MSPYSHVLGPALLAATTSACLIVRNPGFDDGATSSSTGLSVTTGATPTTGASTTTGVTDSSTSDASQTTGPVEPPGPDTDAASTDSTTTDSTTTDDTGGDCAGAPEDLCEAVEILGAPYLVCEQGRPWTQARAVCEAHCMRLVVLDEPESAAVHALLTARMTEADKAEAMTLDPQVQPADARASWWIGGYKERAWLWLDGSMMPPVSQGGWASNNPDINGTDACAAIALYAKGGDDGKWFDRGCEEAPYRFICEPA